ncbi:MAG: alpha/beta fold hydrolase [Verrucomicrobiota bacterium]|mgnify:FL=1|jgi:dienelactone hydrolase|nr:alpha/beta fold hydrolase [Verrucomicrobiota bacterium]MDP6250551.1 alpha/beta fold hydrolase [Verrucomicrobiota bacterium]MDP7177577.1 alpha/beta fold hydrolase [Verrucomicrobiota bacterium]MDP7292504.1 alpha/beta fold hydrolase [Verrucomicrobiota bacterium]HJN83054.1 alpha/beta fold hydrolase [Verrucomicrobiota bacterium]|tara:strand:+ start:2604 stop:3674 length:1071 start_codon:yes stop_codon:yes gene_type:complete
MNRLFTTPLLFAALLTGLAAEPSVIDHSHLLVYRDSAGSEHPVTTPADWAKRRRQIVNGMQQVMGPLPSRTALPPLDMRVRDQADGDGFTRLSIDFVTEKNDRLPALLYRPKAKRLAKRPGILALHPTSPLGKHRVTKEGGVPNRAYAYELAKRGYVVIAPDYPPFGDYKYDFESDDYVSGTMKGVFNHMRCVDLLQSLPEVDPGRIGAIGHSLGGHNAMFVGVFDPRISVIVSSCGWTPFHDYYGGNIKGWTSDRYMPLLKTRYKLDPDRVPFDFYEVVAALAPRVFFSSSPLHDSNFDVRGVKKAVPKAREIYKLLGQADALQLRTPDCEHDFPTEVRLDAYRFIDQALGQADD